MRTRSRALFGVISVGAVLVSAGGLAYLGAVSYRSDRGIVAAQVAEHFQIARHAAGAIDREVRAALDAAAELLGRADESPPTAAEIAVMIEAHPLASRPFRIGARGELWVPGLEPLARPVDPVLDLQESLPRPQGKRAVLLERALRAELGECPKRDRGRCQRTESSTSVARRLYNRLVRHDDTGPAALLGLARLDAAAGDKRAATARYLELANRFGQYRDTDGISYTLWADLGAAESRGDAAALLAVLEQLLDRRYIAPEAFLGVVAAKLRDRLRDLGLDAGDRARLDALSERLSRARATARVDGDLVSIARSAGPKVRGRAGIRERDRVLVYRRAGERDVVGIQLAPPMFGAALAALDSEVPGGQLGVHAIAEEPPADSRVLATASIGPLLPNLVVSLIQSRAYPDPLDEIVRARSRRHMMFSLALGALLVLGLVATVRGAARERELAKLKSDFVSTVSHELKTPLTSIRMFAEMLQQEVAGADRDREAHYHGIIVKESERLGLLIANLLDYSQVERGVRRYALATIDAGEIAAEAVETFRRLAEGEGREVQVSIGDGDLSVRADRESLVQSMLNLLGNAAKYSDADQPIAVSATAAGDRVTLAVTDGGPGIARSEQRRIFREFYRTPEAQKSGIEGTGLGLALVKRHAEALGGTVEVDSEPGKGATFELVLPRANPDDADEGDRA